MHPALEGLLIGAGLAAVLLAAEYYLQRKIALERAAQFKRAVELDADQRKRISSMARFCVFLPPVFALFFWIIFR